MKMKKKVFFIFFSYRDTFIQFAGEDWVDVTGNNQTDGVFVTAPNVGISNLIVSFVVTAIGICCGQDFGS